MSKKRPTTWVEVERFLRRINKHSITPNTMYLPEIALREAFKMGRQLGKSGATLRAMKEILNSKIETPKGVTVHGSKDYKLKGKTTGRAYRCRMDGCPGYRIVVRWEDGHFTHPCSKGMVLTKRGWRIL